MHIIIVPAEQSKVDFVVVASSSVCVMIDLFTLPDDLLGQLLLEVHLLCIL